MPITRAAKKSLRQNARKGTVNLIYRNKLKSLLKEIRLLASQKKNKEAKNILPQVYQILDKAAKVGVIKKNNASRKKSRITDLINKLG